VNNIFSFSQGKSLGTADEANAAKNHNQPTKATKQTKKTHQILSFQSTATSKGSHFISSYVLASTLGQKE